MKILQNSGSLN